MVREIASEQYRNFCWIWSIFLGSGESQHWNDARLEVERDHISLEQETNRGKDQMRCRMNSNWFLSLVTCEFITIFLLKHITLISNLHVVMSFLDKQDYFGINPLLDLAVPQTLKLRMGANLPDSSTWLLLAPSMSTSKYFSAQDN